MTKAVRIEYGIRKRWSTACWNATSCETERESRCTRSVNASNRRPRWHWQSGDAVTGKKDAPRSGVLFKKWWDDCRTVQTWS